jgi:hypothetical protein
LLGRTQGVGQRAAHDCRCVLRFSRRVVQCWLSRKLDVRIGTSDRPDTRRSGGSAVGELGLPLFWASVPNNPEESREACHPQEKLGRPRHGGRRNWGSIDGSRLFSRESVTAISAIHRRCLDRLRALRTGLLVFFHVARMLQPLIRR